MLDLIGITGLKESGKNTAAEVLISKAGYVPDAFADDLKGIIYDIKGISVWVPSKVTPLLPEGGYARYRDIVDELGLETAKKLVPDVRLILQTFGTEAMRSRFGPSVWSDRVLARVAERRALPHPVRTVVTDVRFPDEAEAIKAAGGVVLRILRPSQGVNTDTHASEAAMASIVADAEIINDGSVTKLHVKVLEAFLAFQQAENAVYEPLQARLPHTPKGHNNG